MDQSQSYTMTAEGTDLLTDVLSINGDQPSPERLSAASILMSSGTRIAKHEGASLVPRPSAPPAFDRFQYAIESWRCEGLGTRLRRCHENPSEEKNFRALGGLISATHLYALPSAACISAPVVPGQFYISAYA